MAAISSCGSTVALVLALPGAFGGRRCRGAEVEAHVRRDGADDDVEPTRPGRHRATTKSLVSWRAIEGT